MDIFNRGSVVFAVLSAVILITLSSGCFRSQDGGNDSQAKPDDKDNSYRIVETSVGYFPLGATETGWEIFHRFAIERCQDNYDSLQMAAGCIDNVENAGDGCSKVTFKWVGPKADEIRGIPVGCNETGEDLNFCVEGCDLAKTLAIKLSCVATDTCRFPSCSCPEGYLFPDKITDYCQDSLQLCSPYPFHSTDTSCVECAPCLDYGEDKTIRPHAIEAFGRKLQQQCR